MLPTARLQGSGLSEERRPALGPLHQQPGTNKRRHHGLRRPNPTTDARTFDMRVKSQGWHLGPRIPERRVGQAPNGELDARPVDDERFDAMR